MITEMNSTDVTPAYEKAAEQFYAELLKLLTTQDHPVIIGGTYAVQFYTGISRPTKDIDIFCKAGDYPKILNFFSDNKYRVEIKDDRWLAKIHKGKFFADLIFGSIPGNWPITNDWMEQAPTGTILGSTVKVTPPEELIVSKAYRMGRTNFDGADVTHIMLKCGKQLSWKRILHLMEPHWEILFVHILLFRFTYPSERDYVPGWLMDELLSRLQNQLTLPTPQDKVSRGSMLSHTQYEQAYTEWGYKDITQFYNR